uniref:GAG-pre-integrase domain-containing protein n=1 Tax=Solanum lycopersicum TaxID=4081 RepID=A0A3Q7EGN5_SOLLC
MIKREHSADAGANLANTNIVGTSHSPDTSSGIVFSLLSSLESTQWVVDTIASNHIVSRLDMLNPSTQLSKFGKEHLLNGEYADITHSESPQLSAKVSHPASLYMSIVQDSIPISIWHRRLGHIPLAVMKKMGSLPHRKIDSSITEDKLLDDPSRYHRMVGRLLYLTMTTLDIAFVVQALSQFMHKPKESHMIAAIKVIRYIKNTPGLRLLMTSASPQQLCAYCD